MPDGESRARSQVKDQAPAIVTALIAGRHLTSEEALKAKNEVRTRSIERRRELLVNALTTPQAARLLGVSRQILHDRVEGDTLLEVMDRGERRFPIWQFDPDGEHGVVAGLPVVLLALEVSPIAKASWLTRANPMLDGATPLECLKAGEVERVVGLARAVGFW